MTTLQVASGATLCDLTIQRPSSAGLSGQFRTGAVKVPIPPGFPDHWRIAMSASDGSNFSRRSILKSGVYATVGFAVAGAHVAHAADVKVCP